MLEETLQVADLESEIVSPENTLEVTKSIRVLVIPELYDQLINYLYNSTPKLLTTGEVIKLTEELRKTTQKTEITFGAA